MIFDTDIFIFAERGDEKAQDAILKEKQVKISVITHMELIQGCRNKKEMTDLENFLKMAKCRIVHCSDEISITSDVLIRQYALSNNLRLGDALIAATAICQKETLYTANYKDFRFIGGLSVRQFKPSIVEPK